MTTQNNTVRPGFSPDIKYKDTVFRKLFSEPARLLELYNAMNKSNYTDSSELEINTLDSIHTDCRTHISKLLTTKHLFVNLFLN